MASPLYIEIYDIEWLILVNVTMSFSWQPRTGNMKEFLFELR